MVLQRKARRHEGVLARHNAFEVEGMESRICLSATTTTQKAPPPPPAGSPPPPPPVGVNLKDGRLSVVGDYETANTISVTLDGTNINVSLNGKASVFAAADVQCVLVAGGEEDDTIAVSLGGATLKGPVQIRGGEGNDTINAGAEDDVIFADAGDIVTSGTGNDKVVDATKQPPPPPPPPAKGTTTTTAPTTTTTKPAKPADTSSTTQTKPAKKHHHHKKAPTTTTTTAS